MILNESWQGAYISMSLGSRVGRHTVPNEDKGDGNESPYESVERQRQNKQNQILKGTAAFAGAYLGYKVYKHYIRGKNNKSKTRSVVVASKLKVTLPRDYKSFINQTGVISDSSGEVYGYTERMKDINKIPCVIGATKLYSKSYKNILSTDIVISFDDYLNKPLVLNTTDGKVYSVGHTSKDVIENSFAEWLNNRR